MEEKSLIEDQNDEKRLKNYFLLKYNIGNIAIASLIHVGEGKRLYFCLRKGFNAER